MKIKGLAVPSLAAAGGAGAGAGGAYATGNYLSKTSVEEDAPPETADQSHVPTSKISDVFKPSSCFNDRITNKEDSDKWFLDIDETVYDDVSIDTINPKQGCFIFNLSRSSDSQKVIGANFELLAIDNENEGSSSKGVVIWSTLSKGNDKKFGLLSRALYLSKETNGKWQAKKGWEFSSSVDGATLSGFEKTENKSLEELCKEDANCFTQTPLDGVEGKPYTWQTTGSKNQSLFDLVKITKESDKHALFFGRDLSSTNEIKANITSIYKEGQGWKKIFNKTVVTPLFTETVKGTWTAGTTTQSRDNEWSENKWSTIKSCSPDCTMKNWAGWFEWSSP